jgi:hypothetical protein
MKRKQLSTIMETSVINHVVEEAEEAEAQFSRDSTRTRADAYAPEVLEIHHPHQTNVETEADWRSRSDSEGDEELHHSDTLGEFPQTTVTLTVEEEQQQQQQQQQQVLPTWELAHSFVSEMREIYALYVRRGALNEIDISDTLARDTRTLVKNIETMLKTHPVVTRLSMDSPLMSIRQHQHTLRKIANVYKTCVVEKLYDIKMDSFNRFTMSPLFAELKAQAKQKLQDAKRSDQLALTIYR